MTRVIAAIGFVTLVITLGAGASSIAQDRPAFSNAQLEIRAPSLPCKAEFQQVCAGPMTSEAVGFLTQLLAPLKLPRTLQVQFDECNGAEAHPYVSGQPVVICYEALEHVETTVGAASNLDQAAATELRQGGYIMTALRAVTPAIFDVLNVPVWGRMNDAADRLAAFIMLQYGEDFARNAIEGSTGYLILSGASHQSDLAKIEFPQFQRYFNYLCVAYGGAPITFQPVWDDLFNLFKDEDSRQALTHQLYRCLGTRQLIDKAERERQVDTLALKACLEETKEKPETLYNCIDQILGKVPLSETLTSDVFASEYEQIRQAFDLRIMPFVDPDSLEKVRGRFSVAGVTK